MRVVVIALQIFDTEPFLLFLFGVLLISVQFSALSSLILNVSSVGFCCGNNANNCGNIILGKDVSLGLCLFFAVGSRLLVKLFFYDIEQVWVMGIFL
jgi:hypothetical protein